MPGKYFATEEKAIEYAQTAVAKGNSGYFKMMYIMRYHEKDLSYEVGLSAGYTSYGGSGDDRTFSAQPYLQVTETQVMPFSKDNLHGDMFFKDGYIYKVRGIDPACDHYRDELQEQRRGYRLTTFIKDYQALGYECVFKNTAKRYARMRKPNVQ